MSDLKLLERLINQVMSERQAKVYLALLSQGSSTSAELQKASGVPQTKIYEVVRYLVSQGFCTERKTAHKRTFEAVNPRIALQVNIDGLEARKQKLADLQNDLEEIWANAGKTAEPFEYIEITHGNENVHGKYVELLATAKFELLGFVRPPYASVTQQMYRQQMVHLDRFISNGGISKCVYEIHDDTPPRTYDVIYKSNQMGELFRIVPRLPLKMFIFDRETLLIADKSSLAGKDEISMTVIKQRTTVDGYIALFDFFWEQGEDYEGWIKGKEELMREKMEEHDRVTP